MAPATSSGSPKMDWGNPISCANFSYSGVRETIAGTPQAMLVIIRLLLLARSSAAPSCGRNERWHDRRRSGKPARSQREWVERPWAEGPCQVDILAGADDHVAGGDSAQSARAYLPSKGRFRRLPNHSTRRGEAARASSLRTGAGQVIVDEVRDQLSTNRSWYCPASASRERLGVGRHDVREGQHFPQRFRRRPIVEGRPQVVAVIHDESSPSLAVAHGSQDLPVNPLLHDQGLGLRPVPGLGLNLPLVERLLQAVDPEARTGDSLAARRKERQSLREAHACVANSSAITSSSGTSSIVMSATGPGAEDLLGDGGDVLAVGTRSRNLPSSPRAVLP